MNNSKITVLSGATMLAGLATASAQESAPLFQIGSVNVRPHATYSVVYDDNIFLEHKSKFLGTQGQPGRDHDFVHTFTPGLKLDAGDAAARQAAYFTANYEAAFTRFTHNSGSDATDHNAMIGFGGKLNRLHVGVEQSLQSRSDADAANLAANGRVKRKTWDTKVESDYEVSEKTSVSLDLKQTVGDYKAPLFDSTDRMATLWLDYQVLPKVKMGAGAGVGYLQVDGTAANHNANSAYYQGLVRLAWSATEKLTINASGGIEHRNIQERGAADPDGFVFGVSADWKASERTTVALSATRGRKASNAQVAQLNEETALTGSIKHSLFDRVSLSLDGGYSYSHYKATSTASGALRDDNYFYAKPGLTYKFVERAQATLYYQYRRNDSTFADNGNDFYNNQLGLELSYRF
ncbi:MAG: outer membrane beta-barrel protein [Limisphaerales bacterium]